MWFITYDNANAIDNYVETIFTNRLDAFKYIQSKLNDSTCTNITVKNGDTSLISPCISVGATLQITTNGEKITYGIIDDISDYLVMIKKTNGHVVELTKARINKELILGTFAISKNFHNADIEKR